MEKKAEIVAGLLVEAKEITNLLKERVDGVIKSEEDVCYTLFSKLVSCIDRAQGEIFCMGTTNSATGDDNHHVQQLPTSKREKVPSWSVEVKLSGKGSEADELNGIDEYQWRKYGQKSILNYEHPRAYYRCSRSGKPHDCTAKKYVQKRDDDSSVVHIEYKGHHTCDQHKDKKLKQDPISCNEQQDKQEVVSVNEFPFQYYTTATESVAFEADFFDEIPGESYSAPSSASPCLDSGFESFYNPQPFLSIEEILSPSYS